MVEGRERDGRGEERDGRGSQDVRRPVEEWESAGEGTVPLHTSCSPGAPQTGLCRFLSFLGTSRCCWEAGRLGQLGSQIS